MMKLRNYWKCLVDDFFRKLMQSIIQQTFSRILLIPIDLFVFDFASLVTHSQRSLVVQYAVCNKLFSLIHSFSFSSVARGHKYVSVTSSPLTDVADACHRVLWNGIFVNLGHPAL